MEAFSDCTVTIGIVFSVISARFIHIDKLMWVYGF